MKYEVIWANFDSLDRLHLKILTDIEYFRNLRNILENLIVKKLKRVYGD